MEYVRGMCAVLATLWYSTHYRNKTVKTIIIYIFFIVCVHIFENLIRLLSVGQPLPESQIECRSFKTLIRAINLLCFARKPKWNVSLSLLAVYRCTFNTGDFAVRWRLYSKTLPYYFWIRCLLYKKCDFCMEIYGSDHSNHKGDGCHLWKSLVLCPNKVLPQTLFYTSITSITFSCSTFRIVFN